MVGGLIPSISGNSCVTFLLRSCTLELKSSLFVSSMRKKLVIPRGRVVLLSPSRSLIWTELFLPFSFKIELVRLLFVPIVNFSDVTSDRLLSLSLISVSVLNVSVSTVLREVKV